MKKLLFTITIIVTLLSCNKFNRGDKVIIIQGNRNGVVIRHDFLRTYYVRYQTDIGEYKEIELMEHQIKKDTTIKYE